MAREGATPTKLGPRPRHRARGPSASTMYLRRKQFVREAIASDTLHAINILSALHFKSGQKASGVGCACPLSIGVGVVSGPTHVLIRASIKYLIH